MEKRYRSSLVLMKAMPPHLGHLYLIDTAIKYSDHTHIVICHNSSQWIPGELRFNCIKEIYKDNTNVTVYIFDDTGLPQSDKESNSLDEFYSLWVPVVYGIVESLDVVFTSEDYGDDFARYLGIDHFLVDKDRRKYPISGTMIRNNPIKNWRFISDQIRPFFVKRVAIVGPESTGKSYLTQNLASYFNTNFLPEYGRLVAENKPNLEIDDFHHISEGRQELEDWLVGYSNGLIVCDTEDITTYTYSKMYCPDEYIKYEEYFTKKITSYDYDLYILLEPNCDSVQDGTRKFLNGRVEHFNELKSNLERFCKMYITVGGDWSNRYVESKKLISDLIYNL
jgi:HTH-type transcriptional repressor of NAD biosynthesis genes